MSEKRARSKRPAATNQAQPLDTVPIELGGRTRHLRLDFNAMSDAEDLTGLNLLDPVAWGTMSVKQTLRVLHCALVHEDPALTLEQLGAMLDLPNAERVGKALAQLIRPTATTETTATPAAAAATEA